MMKHTSYFPQDQIEPIETLDEFYDELREYYDELFPLDEGAAALMSGLVEDFRKNSPLQPPPLCRYLGVGCATGTLENRIADVGIDVTGIDRNPDMIETCRRRMKRGYSSVRFFEMAAIDVARYLREGTFHIIACVNNTLPYFADETLIRKFIHDAKRLLAPEGKLVLQVLNFDGLPANRPAPLRERGSVRVTLERSLEAEVEGLRGLKAALERGSGQRLELQAGTKLYPTTKDRLEAWGREAGFENFQWGSDYAGRPWSPESEFTVAVLS